ncbi:MAG: long-chain fatty acid--CoA ligase [Chloroflexi bacterium]|nr:long-chain fatty acid--CoA ligase [Chloroflexota bacterium]
MTIPLIARALAHDQRLALIDDAGQYTYVELVGAARRVAAGLLAGQSDLAEARVAFLLPPGFGYVAVQWGIWLAGGIAVPLCTTHPLPELAYVLEDTAAGILVADAEFAGKLQPLLGRPGLRFALASDLWRAPVQALPAVESERRAMILYTSGTTSKPKGVVSTHRNITAQVQALITAWEWTSQDHILHVLPLHHTHGIINVLACALWTGAVCEMLPHFDALEVWQRFSASDLTLFMAVPTIYTRLIAAWEGATPAGQVQMSRACAKMRLMVSGSAALPVSVFEKWRAISGHTLLERYGMTEISMGLSNPLHGERRPGMVGQPLPGVTIRLVDETGKEIRATGQAGEIEVQGENVFLEYWGRPEATARAFHDGWFRSGDVAVLEDGYYRILGRNSVDIIKSGGYKISALEIEETLRTHPAIGECAVVGVADAEWGERVCAAVVLQPGHTLSLAELRAWARERIAPYKMPSRLQVMAALPCNVMGKVTKPEIIRFFAED